MCFCCADADVDAAATGQKRTKPAETRQICFLTKHSTAHMSTVAQQDVAPLRKKRVTKLYILIEILITYDKYQVQYIPRVNKFKNK